MMRSSVGGCWVIKIVHQRRRAGCAHRQTGGARHQHLGGGHRDASAEGSPRDFSRVVPAEHFVGGIRIHPELPGILALDRGKADQRLVGRSSSVSLRSLRNASPARLNIFLIPPAAPLRVASLGSSTKFLTPEPNSWPDSFNESWNSSVCSSSYQRGDRLDLVRPGSSAMRSNKPRTSRNPNPAGKYSCNRRFLPCRRHGNAEPSSSSGGSTADSFENGGGFVLRRTPGARRSPVTRSRPHERA